MWRDTLTRARSDAGQTHGRARNLGNSDDEASVLFSFENQQVKARLGQSVAAALLANGIRTLRIDEAGNPKGVLCGIGYCFECRCVIDDEPDRRACMVEAKPGMRVRRQQGLA
jgi:sarcosine oxidase subunit alpha